MVNNLPPLAGPVDASGEPERLRREVAMLAEKFDAHVGLMEEHLDNEKFSRKLKGGADDSDTPMPFVRVFESEIVDLRARVTMLQQAAAVPSSPAQPEEMTLDSLITMARCEHVNRAGGNDYILCNDCGLMWDYRKESANDGLVNYLKLQPALQMNNRRPVYPGRKPSTDELSLATFEGAVLAKLNRAEALRLAVDILDLFDALPPSSPAQERLLTRAREALASTRYEFDSDCKIAMQIVKEIDTATSLAQLKAFRPTTDQPTDADIEPALPPSSPVADSPTWLPIETAPRNYKTVLVYLGNDAIATGFRSERGWKVDGWNAPAPTHWMPLPSAPSPSAGPHRKPT